jgi:Uma2 family endonuclease
MGAVLKQRLISVEDYLAGELESPIKHEYLGGFVYAMAGARVGHNVIGGRIFAKLFIRLEGKQCQPYNSDTKVHVKLADEDLFYYPDVSVVCDSNPDDDSHQDKPVVIFEVLSQSTRRIDEREKKDAYLMIPSLKVYALVEQHVPAIVVFRRTGAGFVCEPYDGLDAVLPLGEIGTELPLSEVYGTAGVSPEAEQADET